MAQQSRQDATTDPKGLEAATHLQEAWELFLANPTDEVARENAVTALKVALAWTINDRYMASANSHGIERFEVWASDKPLKFILGPDYMADIRTRMSDLHLGARELADRVHTELEARYPGENFTLFALHHSMEQDPNQIKFRRKRS